MRTFDLTPFYRSTVGFDRLFDMLDNSVRSDWPPYDIEKVGDDSWSVAGRLTLRGVTRPLTLDVSLATPSRQPTAQDERRVRVLGRGRISRSAYGVPAPVLASDQMDLRFDAEFARQPAD